MSKEAQQQRRSHALWLRAPGSNVCSSRPHIKPTPLLLTSPSQKRNKPSRLACRSSASAPTGLCPASGTGDTHSTQQLRVFVEGECDEGRGALAVKSRTVELRRFLRRSGMAMSIIARRRVLTSSRGSDGFQVCRLARGARPERRGKEKEEQSSEKVTT
ncbi:hypothetical protein BC567DRAFT_20456 [Phyllosticta citribraziliensis]